MKTRAAVLRDVGKDFEIVELDLDEPKAGEVLVRFVASGLCHSDDHLRTGDIPVRYPIVGGHEGAGIVERVGPGVTRLAVGDHVVTMAGLRLSVVRLTPDPMPVEGLVVGQSPAAGAAVKGLSTLTVQLWHPPRDQAIPGPKHK